MTSSDLFAVITTIQSPTPALLELHRRLGQVDARLVVAGDRKGPAHFSLSDCDFLSLSVQEASGFTLSRRLPDGHYARKNIAYLEAMRQGARCIYETDDDNAPLQSWSPREEMLGGARVVAGPIAEASLGSRWVNVYKYFTTELIWPRGFPLNEIHASVPDVESLNKEPCRLLRAPIQQGLVNGSPDVDAVWRLTMDRPFEFEDRPSIYLKPGNWCPFNTQSTWWWPAVYPLMYIPSHCSFRMCDIWKSFVAQRCLWELGFGVVYHAPEVIQARNPHDLMRDFRDEIPGYNRNGELTEQLTGIRLNAGEKNVAANLRSCYAALIDAEFFPEKEMSLVDAWLEDVRVNHLRI